MARLLLLLFSFFISSYSFASSWALLSQFSMNNRSDNKQCTSTISEKMNLLQSSYPSATLSYNADLETAQEYGCVGTLYVYAWQLPKCEHGDPVYPATSCPSPDPDPEPEPHQCPNAGTFVDKTWGREGLNGWSTCRSDNCVVAAQVDNHSSMPSGVCYVNDSGKRICRYDLFYTGQACTYNPDGGTGINPPDHEYPTDPVKPPNPDNPPPSPDLPDEGGDVTPPIYDPDAEDDGLPDDPVQPPNPDPTPDPDDPNLSDGENAVVGELSEANQRLENIDHTLQDLTNTTKSDNDALIEYQSHLLGEMKQMNQQLADGVGSGGGGGNGDGNGEGSCEGEDCNPVGFPGAPEVVDPFAEILDETDINDILTRTEEVKTQLQTQMNNFKGLFRVPDYGTGGDIAPVEFDLKHAGTTIPVKFGIFSQISADISSIIVMIAAFIAFLIVTTRR